MPFFGFLFLVSFSILVFSLTIIKVVKYAKTRQSIHLKKLALIWLLPLMLVSVVVFNHFPIDKDRIVGTYRIDTSFYPGENATWQHKHFHFEITDDDKFIFYEKLADGSYRETVGSIYYFKKSPPMLFRIYLKKPHELIDNYPSLYRGNRKFYYVFESAYGNMFYRKVDS